MVAKFRSLAVDVRVTSCEAMKQRSTAPQAFERLLGLHVENKALRTYVADGWCENTYRSMAVAGMLLLAHGYD